MWWDGGLHMGWMFFWGFCGLALIAVVVWLLSTNRRFEIMPDAPELILKRRYANGEIDNTTYLHLLDDLKR